MKKLTAYFPCDQVQTVTFPVKGNTKVGKIIQSYADELFKAEGFSWLKGVVHFRGVNHMASIDVRIDAKIGDVLTLDQLLAQGQVYSNFCLGSDEVCVFDKGIELSHLGF